MPVILKLAAPVKRNGQISTDGCRGNGNGNVFFLFLAGFDH
jgi:hypothetical protein